ncbi:MAG: hypothetical protein ACOY3D_00885 [Candidatus Omnitrophota bacterium]
MKGNLPKIIILLVAAFFAYKSLSKGIKEFTARPVGTATEESAATEPVPSEELSNLATEPAASPSNGDSAELLGNMGDYGRMPFATPAESKSTATETSPPAALRTTTYEPPQLTTILNYGGRWFAVINGILVKAGEKVGKVVVLSIEENAVTIEEAGKVYRLRLWPEGIGK